MTPPRSDELVAACGGTVVTTGELNGRGVARSTIAYRCRAGGPWQSLLPGVVLLHNGPPTRADRRRAALLYCDEPLADRAGAGRAVLTGLDALDLHGLRRIPHPSGPVHVLVAVDIRRTGRGRLMVERTTRLPAPTAGRWPLAPVPRAALDYARRIRDRGVVRSSLAEAVQRGMCTVRELSSELAAGPIWGSALPREVLAEVGDGVRSAAEAAARTLARRSGLPAPLWNPRLYDQGGRLLAVPDAWFDDVAMAWEIDSREWHLSPDDYSATLDRRAALMAAGTVVVHHQPSALERKPAQVLADLRANHAHAARRPRPPLRAVSVADAAAGRADGASIQPGCIDAPSMRGAGGERGSGGGNGEAGRGVLRPGPLRSARRCGTLREPTGADQDPF